MHCDPLYLFGIIGKQKIANIQAVTQAATFWVYGRKSAILLCGVDDFLTDVMYLCTNRVVKSFQQTVEKNNNNFLQLWKF